MVDLIGSIMIFFLTANLIWAVWHGARARDLYEPATKLDNSQAIKSILMTVMWGIGIALIHAISMPVPVWILCGLTVIQMIYVRRHIAYFSTQLYDFLKKYLKKR